MTVGLPHADETNQIQVSNPGSVPSIASSRRSVAKTHLAVLAFYTFLTLAFTYPAAFSWGVAVPGTERGDVWVYLWNLWWIKAAVFDFHQSPLFSNFIFYPQGVSLNFHTLSLPNGLFFLPFTSWLGPVFSYNLIGLLSFVLAGWTTFLLARYLRLSVAAGLLAGLVFAFSPYHFAHYLGHLDLTTIQWLPVFVLFLLRSFYEPGKANPIAAGVLFALNALNTWYYGVYLALFFLFFAAWAMIFLRKRAARGLFIRVVLGTTAAVLVLAPVVVPMGMELLRTTNRYMAAPALAPYLYSADLVAFFKPSWLHPLWGQAMTAVLQRFSAGGAEGEVFLGFTVLTLATWGAIRERKRSSFWALIAVVFGLFALGPALQVLGKMVLLPSGEPFPMPYRLLQMVPVMDLPNAASRFVVITMLALAILAGLGFDSIARDGKTWKRALAYSSILLVAFEFWPAPIKMAAIPSIPSFYKTLAAEPGKTPILDIPVAWRWMANQNLFSQTVHQQQIAGGNLARMQPYPLLSSPLFRQVGAIDYSEDIVRQDPVTVAPTILTHYGFRYVTIHKDTLNSVPEELWPAGFAIVKKSEAIGPTVYEDSEVKILSVEPPAKREIFVEIGEGWSDREERQGTPTRRLSSQARLIINSPDERKLRLEMTVGLDSGEDTLELRIDDREVQQARLQGGPIRLSVEISVRPGSNTLILRSGKTGENAPASGPKAGQVPGNIYVQDVSVQESTW